MQTDPGSERVGVNSNRVSRDDVAKRETGEDSSRTGEGLHHNIILFENTCIGR